MDKLLTVRDVSGLLIKHPTTIYRLVKDGDLPAIRRRRLGIRFRREDIEEWVAKGKQIPRPDFGSYPVFPEIPLKVSRHRDKKAVGGVSEMAKAKTKSRLNYGFGAVYQRITKGNNVRWYLDYRDSKGKRVQKLAPLAVSKEEAVLALQEAVRCEFDSEYRVKREREKVTFRQLADTYINDYAKSNKRSWKCDSYRLEASMKPFFGDYELKEITPLIIERYRAVRLGKSISRSSVNREITIMKRMFNLAIDWNLAEANPFVKVKLFSEKDAQKERILEYDEEERLFKESPEYLKPILRVALNTGMRRGEILNLRWKQVDMERRMISVQQTKSGKNRLIPMNDVLFGEFSRLKTLLSRSEVVFANPRTGLPYTQVRKSFKGACKMAGISNLRFHDLRHTFATRLIRAGVDIITVKELLGHFSIRMTQRYTHSNQDQQRMAVARLAQKRVDSASEAENLLRICDTAELPAIDNPASHSNSIN
jgi:excisionase family DNA binding protein